MPLIKQFLDLNILYIYFNNDELQGVHTHLSQNYDFVFTNLLKNEA